MDRAFESGASASPPDAPSNPSIGYPTAGNPSVGIPATKPGRFWFHMITEELRALIVAAGLQPSQSDLSQVLQALPGALASRPEMARSLLQNGHHSIPGGLMLRWGSAVTNASWIAVFTYPLAFPNAALQAWTSYNAGLLQGDRFVNGGAAGLASMSAYMSTDAGVPVSGAAISFLILGK